MVCILNINTLQPHIIFKLSVSLIGFLHLGRVQQNISEDGKRKRLHFSLLNALLITLIVMCMCSFLPRDVLINSFDRPHILKMLFNHNTYFFKLLKQFTLIFIKNLNITKQLGIFTRCFHILHTVS